MKSIKWGIIAPGNIAQKFAAALQQVDRAELYSVASRNKDRALKFAQEFGFAKAADSYQALVDDSDVDAVYIASPHNLHMEQSLMCLHAGKAVLCEKPMTVNAAEAERVLLAAEQNNVFYMEAVWTRFMPIYAQIRQWLDQGRIGEVQMIQASFGFAFKDRVSEKGRLFNADLAGGATLDLGIYPITFAQWVLGKHPSDIKAIGHLGETDVDEQTGILIKYPTGEIATLSATVCANTNYDGWIYGSKGQIKVPMFWCAESATLITQDGEETIEIPHSINGYEGEIEEVHNCLDRGLIESPTLPWQESLNIMHIMDEVRSQMGLQYPFE